DPEVREPELAEGGGEGVGGVAGAVVAHDRLHRYAPFGKPGYAALEEGDRAGRGQIVEHLGVGEAGAVVDDHVQVLVAGQALHPAFDPPRVLAAAVAEHAVAGAQGRDPAELFDVDVDELARMPS